MAKSKKLVAAPALAEPAEVASPSEHQDYMIKAEKHGCPVLDVLTLIAEGLQAWRHHKGIKTAKAE